uniref:Si:ch73-288o11.4 n=1 Tax=Cyprinus carpio TaxID=7962 RepID=A0A8C1LRH5_CYPCA
SSQVCLLRVCILLFMVVSCNADFIYGFVCVLVYLGCVDSDGVIHDFNSEWEKDCYNCLCALFGIRCCNKIPTVIEHPDECEMVVDKTTCSFTLALVSDHSKPCPFA